jgi:aldose sugar dehydrogenase
VRLERDGSIPDDNPFVGRQGAQAAIWSYGHRNIEAAAFHPDSGELWIVEMGPLGGDELNRPEPGRAMVNLGVWHQAAAWSSTS